MPLLKTYPNEIEASIDKGLLESAGIACTMLGGSLLTMEIGATFMNVVELHVADCDKNKAIKILQQYLDTSSENS